jgi:hypothetical protein
MSVNIQTAVNWVVDMEYLIKGIDWQQCCKVLTA